ncbi:SIMPL domain-containing protein [Neobacillus mesonae]|uniref:SIMPL domain-containing protein n=1 Tax=Neobacillus mesonae TaxID=1193713 RepID=UPI00203CA18E|nr:SIMPL domain-containing protein [Neobacillus mesonae]MCM3566651.1 SIMPL domain-containing protein [Neobacillus mesonae]
MFHYRPQYRQTNPEWFVMKVKGEGEIAAKPDSASINLGIITEGKELEAVQKQNSQNSKNVIDSLISQGVHHEQLKTFDYRIESDYDYVEGKQIFRGYKVSHILQVKLEDLSIVGKVVDYAVQSGVNYVSNVQFSVKQKDPYYRKALISAIEDSLEKAKTMAASLKVYLVPTPRLIVEGETTFQPFSHQPETFVKGISSTQFEPGQILIKANILAEFHYRTI